MLVRTLMIASAICTTVVACSDNNFEPVPYELSEGAAVRITITAGAQGPGARVSISVHNQSAMEYVWNPCVRTLERRNAADWGSVDEGERICTLEGWVLRPQTRTDATTDLPALLPPGEYRLRYSFGRTVGEHSAFDQQVSNSFSVTR